MSSQEILEMVAKGMVAAGVYKDVSTAIKAIALEQVERKIADYTRQVQDLERKYKHSLEEHSRLLKGKATVEEEEEWMDWKGAEVMLQAWQKALQELLNSGA
ncbi:MAG: hypothetical protein ACREQ7_13480 [Candidatus Binatia bacterium]